MEMSLINAGLAAGAALAALPVILHLFMRQTPKHIIFPAVKLVRERQRQSKKRMRIKNWLLLLARMAILALMALALARPRLYSEVPLGDDSVPTALGLVFDTSLSMEYKDKDKTRLQEAQARAKEIVEKLADTSLVFIVDSAAQGLPIGLSPAAARKQIDSLTIRPVNRPLNAAMGQVYPAVAECDRPAHVVYVFTDLMVSAWDTGKPAEGLDNVAKTKSDKGARITTFVLRLAPEEINDVAVVSAEPTSSVATQGEPVEIHAKIRSVGKGTKPVTRMVEFELDGKKKGEKSIELPASGGEREVVFTTGPRLQEGELHRGRIKLSGTPDPFERDDLRFFTFKVRPPLKVLVVSSYTYDSSFVAAALDPDLPGVPRSFLVDRVLAKAADGQRTGMPTFESKRSELATYSAVFLLNVKELEEADWGALNHYVHEGGGLVVAPGHVSQPADYGNPTASQFLPAALAEQAKSPRPSTTFGKVASLTHPLFQRYGNDYNTMLSQMPVYRYWPIKDQAEATRVLLSFADGAPALIEREFKGPKTGRVLLWTTPLSRVPDVGGPAKSDSRSWNELPGTSAGWSFFVLMNDTVPYLAGAAGERLDWEAGDNVLLKLDPTARFTNFQVTGPDQKTRPGVVHSPSSEFLAIDRPEEMGAWTVKAITPDKSERTLGFSVNPPEKESLFTVADAPVLDGIFGKDGYKLAEDQQKQKDITTKARLGQEIFPWLMFLILMVVTLENFLANTFYKEAPKQNGAPGLQARFKASS
jgi:Aerotolerance regulator N-terminal